MTLATGSLARAMQNLEELLATSDVLQARFDKTEEELRADHIFFGEAELPEDADPGEQLPDSYIVLIEAAHGYAEYAEGGSHHCLSGMGGVLMLIFDKPRGDDAKVAHLDFTDFVSTLIDQLVLSIVPTNDVPFRRVTMLVEPHRSPTKSRGSMDVQSAMYRFDWGVDALGALYMRGLQ